MDRAKEKAEFIGHLQRIETAIQTKSATEKKGIFVMGDSGVGKTTFVFDVLRALDYDIMRYDAGDTRNKTNMNMILSDTKNRNSVLDMFKAKPRKMVLVMDELDGMSADKGGLCALIKALRLPVKMSAAQAKKKAGIVSSMVVYENVAIPIVCISNMHLDKKLKELAHLCHVVELARPVCDQGDFRKLMCKGNRPKSSSDDSKCIAHTLLSKYVPMADHTFVLNENERTIVALLMHENVVDMLPTTDRSQAVQGAQLYARLLDLMCFSDYVDRITFQRQVWQFNEMSSLIKAMMVNWSLALATAKTTFAPIKAMRFTKMLTKYSSEYNNELFIQRMCQTTGCGRAELLSLIRSKTVAQILETYEGEMTKLDVHRMLRYLEKYVNAKAVGVADDDVDDDDEDVE